jgi:hypothetical protein
MSSVVKKVALLKFPAKKWIPINAMNAEFFVNVLKLNLVIDWIKLQTKTLLYIDLIVYEMKDK